MITGFVFTPKSNEELKYYVKKWCSIMYEDEWYSIMDDDNDDLKEYENEIPEYVKKWHEKLKDLDYDDEYQKKLKERLLKHVGQIKDWNVSEITNMDNLFADEIKFNEDISGWDVSNVTSMSGMFENAQNFNQNISGWDVSKVTNMSDMFSGAKEFSQDISGWERKEGIDDATSTSTLKNVTNMSGMFSNATSFHQDISNWNISNVTNMKYMFVGTRYYNSLLKI